MRQTILENNINEKLYIICNNITLYGLLRYDPRDISDYAAHSKNAGIRNVKSKLIQFAEAIDPIWVRRLLGCQPRLYPTTFTFLAEAQLDSGDMLPLNVKSTDLMNQCLAEYYCGDGYWKFKPNNSFYPNKENTDQPSMPLYMLTRCNNILTRLAIRDDNETYIAISRESLKYMFKHHTVFSHIDGTENISYYYNSIDDTINVNTEVLDWISQIPGSLENREIYSHFKAILEGVLNEQNRDGSWYYNSKAHMKKYGISSEGTIDCHHSATVIYNLIHVYKNVNEKYIDKTRLRSCIIKGMFFFTTHFFDKNGDGITIVGKKRKASSVQYSEALIAIIEYLSYIEINSEYEELASNIVKKLCSIVNADGSCPGDSKIRPININNINWGNGPVLFALSHYLRKYEGK